MVHITITQKGEATIKEVQERHQELMESYFKILPDEDIEHLRRIFAVIISDLDKR